MANIKFGNNINYQGDKPNFDRDAFKTIEDMKNFEENWLPDVFIAVCYEDGNLYVFNRNNEFNDVTGRWRLMESGGDKLKTDITAAYRVGGVAEGKELSAGTSFESIFKQILEGEKVQGSISYYGVAPEKHTDLTLLTKVEEVPNFSLTIDAHNEYVIIACPNDAGEVSIFSNGFDYTTSFTKLETSAYTFYYSEVKVTCSDFTYTVSYTK